MSEMATAGASAPATTTTSSTPATTASPTSTSQASTGASTQGLTGTQDAGQSKNPQTQAANPADEFVEVKVGSVVDKVSKKIAEAIKNLEKGFHSKSQEAAEKARLEKLARENPKEYYKQTGKDPYALAEEWLAEKYELMQMSPEQRELMELKAEKAQREQIERQSKSEIVKELKEFYPQLTEEEFYKHDREALGQALAEKKQFVRQTQSALENELVEAWKSSGLPKNKHFGAQMAFLMMNHEKVNKTPLQAKEAAAKVKTQFLSDVKSVFSEMDPKGIQELLGEEILTKLRKYDVEKATGKSALPTQKSPDLQSASGNKKVMNELEYRKFMGL